MLFSVSDCRFMTWPFLGNYMYLYVTAINPKNSFDHIQRGVFTYTVSFSSHQEPSYDYDLHTLVSVLDLWQHPQAFV